MNRKKLQILVRYFTKGEKILWGLSSVLIIISFFAFDRENYLTLIASLIGVSSLILNAKGNPAGQFLMVKHSVWYYLFYVRLLRRDDNLFGHDCPDGCYCIDFMD